MNKPIRRYDRDYPVNIRFGQHLTDLGLDPDEYFNTKDGEGEDDPQCQALAQALYVKFYADEIGLEEMDIFDMKIKFEFDAQKSLYKALLLAQVDVATEEDFESIKETTGTDTTTFNNTMTDTVITDHTENTETVYQDVAHNEVDKSGSATHAHTGTDTRTPNLTEKVKKGAIEHYRELFNIAPSVFESFTEHFKKYFMEVL